MTEQQTHTTSINRSWFIKLGIFWIVCVGITIWGLLDGFIIYPNRGAEVAQFTQRDYLMLMDTQRRLRPDAVNVADPAAVLDELASKAEQNRALMSDEEQARLQWLESLDRIHSMSALTAENDAEMADGTLNRDTTTMFVRPRDTLASLQTELANRTPPKALSYWDIPSQFIIAAVFGVFALGLTWRILTTLPKKYRYDPSTMTLTTPSGASFTPADIEVVDKRKWSKFFVTLEMKDGASHTLDLMRFVPLEAWVLEMEKHTDGYVPDEDDEPAASAADTAESEHADAQQHA